MDEALAGSTMGAPAWTDLHTSLESLNDLFECCLSAFGDVAGDTAKVSAATKKKQCVRAIRGLESGKQLIKAISANLQELQQSSQHWENNAMHASHSQHELMQQLEHTSTELNSSMDRLRQAEAERLTAWRELEHLRQQAAASVAEKQAMNVTIAQLKAELQSATFGANEAQCHLSDLQGQVDRLAAAAEEAQGRASAAAAALQSAQQEVDKERASRTRHEDAIARLTADNLVFMAKLRAAESTAAAATAEKDELLLALEEHKGPWLDEVHQGVEQRVKEALARAEHLEQQQEQTAKQNAEQLAVLQQQQSDLEAALQQERESLAALQQELAQAQAAGAEACSAAEEASVLAAHAQAAADERAAELRVAQESLRAMRGEVNEHWMSERSARAQLAELQIQLETDEAARVTLQKALQARTDELATQRAVNQQLMLKKEEVEWQLMAAIAQLHGDDKLQHSLQHSHSLPVAQHSPLQPGPLTAAKGAALQQLPTSQQKKQQVVLHSEGTAAGPGMPEAHQQQQQHQPGGTGDQAVLAGNAAAAGNGTLSIAVAMEGDNGVSPASRSSPFRRLSEYQPFGVPSPTAGRPDMAYLQQLPASASLGHLQQAPQGMDVLPQTAGHPMTLAQQQHHQGELRPDTHAVPGVSSLTAGVNCVGSGLVPSGDAVADVAACFVSDSGISDIYSLPSLSYGLATLPPPELLAALGRTSSLGNCAADGKASTAGSSLSAGGVTGDVMSGKGWTVPGVLCSAGSLTLARNLSGVGGGVGGVLPAGAAGSPGAVIVGTTGGLMAPFSPLPRRHSGLREQASRGAVFPESATASAVSDDGIGAVFPHSITAGAAHADSRQLMGYKSLSFPPARTFSGSGAATSAPPDLAAAAATAAAAAAGSSSIAEHHGVHHGILIGGPNSRPRSPAVLSGDSRGISPSSSLRSVRFSLEGLDHISDDQSPGSLSSHEKQNKQHRKVHLSRRHHQHHGSDSRLQRLAAEAGNCRACLADSTGGSASGSVDGDQHGQQQHQWDQRQQRPHSIISNRDKHDAGKLIDEMVHYLRGDDRTHNSGSARHLSHWQQQQQQQQQAAQARAAAAARGRAAAAAAAAAHAAAVSNTRCAGKAGGAQLGPAVHPVFGALGKLRTD